MSGSVIVAGARTPIGRLLGSLKDFTGAQLGGVAIKAALDRAGRQARAGAVHDHGSGAHRRRRPDPGPAGRGRRGHPDGRARADDQQGLPVRPRRHRARRPADPRRRVRHRRRRRPGVDDPGAAPAAQVALRLQVRRRHPGRPHGLRRPVLRVRPGRHGRLDGEVQLPLRHHPRAAGRLLRRARTSAPPRRSRTASSPRRSRRSPSRSARATRWCSTPTRACARDTTAERPRASCARPSPPTAPSPRARPRRSPTAPPRSS